MKESTTQDAPPPPSSSLPPLLSGIQKTLGAKLMQKITSSKILLVGSGGIGCELLKNLSLSGFSHVEVIDLDTIDVSNLNRQFLFRRQHVGMPKCTVACEAALAMFPKTSGDENNGNGNGNGRGHPGAPKYIAHHGNVCDNSRFNVQYVSSFDLVLNALDNVAARRRVNRLCLAASTPLIEAGTTGYLGQVTVIDKPSSVECYECQAKPTQKVYPICTIRSTPSMPVHTIVWAKELYKLLFGPKVEESMLFEDQSGDEKSTYMDVIMELRESLQNSKGEKEISLDAVRENAAKAFVALYHTEIQKQLDMDRFKTAQKVPTCIPMEEINTASKLTTMCPSQQPGYKQTKAMSQVECIHESIACVLEAADILHKGGKMIPEFDKDDILAMRFVACTSNLRSYVFGIEPIQSHYSAKGIAGNIIPAIATTNAIVAGLQVLQAFHIMKKQVEEKKGELNLKSVCKYTYCLRDKTRKGYYLQPTTLPDPNPKCFVCRNSVIYVTVPTDRWTLDTLLRRVIKKELGFMEPGLNIGSSIIYEEGEDIDEEEYATMKNKILKDLPAGGMQHGTMVTIEDFTQDLTVEMCIYHKSEWEPKEEGGDAVAVEEEEQFNISGDKPVAKEETKEDAADEDGEKNNDKKEVDDNDDIVMVVDDTNTPSAASNGNNKRSADDIGIVILDEGAPSKKVKLSN